MKDHLPLGSTWLEQQRLRAAAKSRRPSRLHLTIVACVLALLFLGLQFISLATEFIDSSATLRIENEYGLPLPACTLWVDCYYPPPDDPGPLRYVRRTEGINLHPSGLFLNALVGAVLVGFGVYLHSLVLTRGYARVHGLPPQPVVPKPKPSDETLDGEPATPAWDEAKLR